MRIYKNYLVVLIGLISSIIHVCSQIQPLNNAKLNYTHVLFTVPWVPSAVKYKLTIWDKRNPNIKIVKEIEANKLIEKSLTFNTQYAWNYEGIGSDGSVILKSPEYEFSTDYSTWIDSSQVRYKVIKNASDRINDGIIFFDYGRVAVDRTGKPIWFLPNLPEVGSGLIRYIHPSSYGNIMLLSEPGNAFEMDLIGNVKWKAPNDGTVSKGKFEFYHHDFKKLNNGNYMVLGNCRTKKIIPGKPDSADIHYGTIIEYNAEGKVVWFWNSQDYFTDEYIFSNKTGNEFQDRDLHMNAFYANDKYVYAGFKNISTILKINKSTKAVVASYGDGYQASLHYGKGFFRLQHDVCMLKNGNIAVINNDSVMKPDVYSSLVIFSEPRSKKSSAKKVFEFSFKIDALSSGKCIRSGNLEEMANGNLLVNTGGENRIFEVNENKEILWDMIIEKYNSTAKVWIPFPQYRLSFGSSLYPYCFSVKSQVTKNGNSNMLEGTVWNIGSETDTYTLIIEQDGKQIFNEVIAKNILSNGSSKLMVKVPAITDGKKSKGYIYSTSGVREEIAIK